VSSGLALRAGSNRRAWARDRVARPAAASSVRAGAAPGLDVGTDVLYTSSVIMDSVRENVARIAAVVLSVVGIMCPGCRKSHEAREWTRTLGGPGVDVGYGVEQTADGGYVIVGRTESYGAGANDVWLVRVDAFGDTVWTRTFGGPGDDWGRAVDQTSDGGFVVAGWTESFGAGGADVWLIKTDAGGNVVWDRTFGGADHDMGYSVHQTRDGGYVLAGFTRSRGAGEDDVWLIKTDADGDSVWTRTFGGAGADVGSSVQQTQEGGYVIAGLTQLSGGTCAGCLICTDSLGDVAWNRAYGSSGIDEGTSVWQTLDGGYIATGSTDEGAGSGDVWLVKTGPDGVVEWTRTFGGSETDWGYCVQQTSDEGYVVVGGTWSYGAGDEDMWLIKTNANGDTVWTRTFGGASGDEAAAVQQTPDGGFVVVGTTHSFGAGSCDVWVVKTDAEGRVDDSFGSLLP
jgi:hypothetical protein